MSVYEQKMLAYARHQSRLLELLVQGQNGMASSTTYASLQARTALDEAIESADLREGEIRQALSAMMSPSPPKATKSGSVRWPGGRKG